MLEVGNSTSVELQANQVIPFNTVFFNTNDRTFFDESKNALTIKKSGIYKVGGNFVFVPSANGIAKISMYVNGVEFPTAQSTQTVVSGNTYTFSIPSKYVKTIPYTNGSVVPITFVTNIGGTLNSANAYVYYNEKINE